MTMQLESTDFLAQQTVDRQANILHNVQCSAELMGRTMQFREARAHDIRPLDVVVERAGRQDDRAEC